MIKKILLFLSVTLALFTPLMAFTASSYPVTFKDVYITDPIDGVQISARVYYPEVKSPVLFPAIVMPNSWDMNKFEYIVQAKDFAEEGYVALTYSARGWGSSTGKVDGGGPNDMADIKAILDWLPKNTPTDASRVGMAGISYGGGLSLLAAAHFPTQVKVVAAMSGWADLYDSLDGNGSPARVWGELLLQTGKVLGHLPEEIQQNYDNITEHRNMAETIAWAKERSPDLAENLATLNQYQTPIYLSNNFEDRLFKPNYLLTFFNQLKTNDKYMDLNQGIHATAELSGLVDIAGADKSNYVWNHVHGWFDHYLKGVNNEFVGQPKINMQVRQSKQYIHINPVNSNDIQETHYYLLPRHLESKIIKDSAYHRYGSLQSVAPNEILATNQINADKITGISSGVPILSSLLQPFVSTPAYFPLVSTNGAITYISAPVTEDKLIAGTAEVTAWVKPSSEKMQLIAYLYDECTTGLCKGWGTLISHGPVTLYHAATSQAQKVVIPLRSAAYELAKGHALALAFATHDLLYTPPASENYTIEFNYPAVEPAELVVPYYQG
ncbi:CocE/NonD family hydrolase [Piscirickettsia litoralis]|uniref:Xaa-Pro dipeptidyl-peptidase C-terminal domain-containing protein n=1 Tax=Piscirickettsia litoralis TaxID=1891921 RepID=A0ABX3A4W8_9GAMM|nr:CocE/NonD family hydrolase [Piscirickettsia litoralis]ODN42711.1 hypothetical protein BGC07_06985 [Piscirickettsia litoralis]